MSVDPRLPFGRMLTAMVSPMNPDGTLDLAGAQQLANHLVDAGNEGLVISGTTGESPTTTDGEKDQLLRAVVEAVGHRAYVIAGVGTNNTNHSLQLAAAAKRAGAHGLLVVTPYYNRPAQDALLAHFWTIADATDLPVVLYDIPGRSGVAIDQETLVRLAEHPRIVAVKDAKGSLGEASWTMARSGLAFYSGEDMLNLPLLSVGGVGVMSVVGHAVTPALVNMIKAHVAGQVTRAAELHRSLLPVYLGIFRNQGVIMAKAACELMGLPGGTVRMPLLPASVEERAQLATDLRAGGVLLPNRVAA